MIQVENAQESAPTEEATERASLSEELDALEIEEQESAPTEEAMERASLLEELEALELEEQESAATWKQTRRNSPSLRSVREEWAHKIRTGDPQFTIYNEASLGLSEELEDQEVKAQISKRRDVQSRGMVCTIKGSKGADELVGRI